MAVKVTVAVPIYNVEPYLEQCVNSILAQTYENIEILLVDDGSTDGCGVICDRFALQDSRVRVIHKENGGLSSTRNAALDAATGEYIIFLDGDDWIESAMIEAMAAKAEENDADLATVNLCSFSDETGEILKERVMPQMQDSVIDFSPAEFRKIRELYGTQLTLFGANSLYRVALARQYGLRFEPTKKVLSEDQLFNFCFYAAMHRAVFVIEPMYHYRIRSVSLSHEQKPVDILDRRITWVHCLRQFLTSNGFPRQSETLYTSLCWGFFIDGCNVLGSAERVIEGIQTISPSNRSMFRKMLRRMLCGKAGRQYIRANKMDMHAALYFRFMMLLMLLGKYDRPAKTYLSH